MSKVIHYTLHKSTHRLPSDFILERNADQISSDILLKSCADNFSSLYLLSFITINNNNIININIIKKFLLFKLFAGIAFMAV